MKGTGNGRNSKVLSKTTKNPNVKQYATEDKSSGNKAATRRYFAGTDDQGHWPPQLNDYNKRFTAALDKIKRRHDGVVTTVGR